MEEKEVWMKEALEQAKKAYKAGEVPVGAVLVYKGKILCRAYNKTRKKKNALQHAELRVIHKACKKFGDWRLLDCELYVTLEPCPMCAGAILNSRIKEVYFGAKDENYGAAGTKFDVLQQGALNHKVKVEGGILQEESVRLMKDFFREKREKKIRDNRRHTI